MTLLRRAIDIVSGIVDERSLSSTRGAEGLDLQR
jgi:hypothetical protein